MDSLTLARIANLSYTNDETFRRDITALTQPDHIYFFDASVNGFSDAQMYVLDYPDQVLFAIRGTSSTGDGITDARFWKESFQDVQYCNYVDQKRYRNIRVHSGFLSQYNTVKFCILANVFQRLWRKAAANDTTPVRILFTSHSLGAAVSCLAAACLKAHFGERVWVQNTTFGCPRVGNRAFVDFYETNVDQQEHFVNENDIITRVPRIGYGTFSKTKTLGDPGKDSFVHRWFGSGGDHLMDHYIGAVQALCATERIEMVSLTTQEQSTPDGSIDIAGVNLDTSGAVPIPSQDIHAIAQELTDSIMEVVNDSSVQTDPI